MRRIILAVLFCAVSSSLYAQTLTISDPTVPNSIVRPGNKSREAMNVANTVQEAIETNISNFLSNLSSTVVTSGAAPTVIGQKGVAWVIPRHDANTTLCDTDGKWCPPQMTALGNIKMAVLEGANTDVSTNATAAGTTTGPLVETLRSDTLATKASSGTNRHSPLLSNSAGAVFVTEVNNAAASGLTPASVISAGSTNATVASNAPGNLYGMTLVNSTATKYFIKFYNTSTTPTCSNAATFLIEVPPGDGGISPYWGGGVGFTTGISYCIVATGTLTANDSAATGVTGVILYKQ